MENGGPRAREHGVWARTRSARGVRAAMVTALMIACGAGAQPASEPRFDVSSFSIRFAAGHPGHPAIEAIAGARVGLSLVDGVYVAGAGDGGSTLYTLGELMGSEHAGAYSASAINAISKAIGAELNRLGIVGVFVVPDEADLDARTGEDKRPGARGPLTLVIHTTTVGEVASAGAGPRWEGVESANHAAHERIRRNSPMRVGADRESSSLMRKDLLDEYLARLNRRPGRRVDASMDTGAEPGTARLEYRIAEVKPWTLYVQGSNTGTDQTSLWRERVGFVHNQLTGRDDTLSLAFVTGDFTDANALAASYDAPVGDSGTFRYKVYGSVYEFQASELGFGDDEFEGDGWTLGGELSREIWRHGDLFLDAVGGARLDHIHSNNQVALIEGEEDFLVPSVGVRLERFTTKATTTGSLMLEAGLSSLFGTEASDVEELGRTDADEDWAVLRGDVSHSFYLEPAILGSAWDEPSTGASRTTLAHELALSVRGQWAFGHRLIPQAEDVAGGMYSVRGYPEAMLAGDSVLIASAEYRVHVPRLLGVDETPARLPMVGEFSVRRPSQYSNPDWDLVLRGFVDAGSVISSDRLSFENNESLFGAGVGVEVTLKRNVNARADWGVALSDVRDDEVTAGSSRFHLSLTVLY